MITTRFKLYAAGLIAALLFGIYTTNTHAIEGESIVMSPASIRLAVNAGETQKGTLKIINDGTVAYDFAIYASPYSVADRTYEPNYNDVKANTDVYTWVSFDKKEYSLKPGESIDVPYTITVPADAAPGGHYGVLFAETQTNESENSQIARKKRVGSIVYANINGEYINAGQQIGAQIDWLQLGGPITATVSVENTGNTDYTMTELLEVRNVMGGVVHSKSNERIILPKTTRDINLAWTGGPVMGLYNVKVETKILDKVTTTTSWVLLMPMWILVVMVLLIMAILYYAFFRHRRR